MMSSHSCHIWALICCCCMTQWDKQPLLFTWELVSCTHTEAFRQPALFGSWLQKHFCHPGTLASTKHPQHHQLFTTSAVCSCVCVSVCASVFITACVVTICSHRIFGEQHSPHLSQNLNIGLFLWISLGQEHNASFMDSTEDLHWTSWGWGLLLARATDSFCFARCLALSSSKLWTWLEVGYKPVPFCLWIHFVDLSKCLKQIICCLCPGDI